MGEILLKSNKQLVLRPVPDTFKEQQEDQCRAGKKGMKIRAIGEEVRELIRPL